MHNTLIYAISRTKTNLHPLETSHYLRFSREELLYTKTLLQKEYDTTQFGFKLVEFVPTRDSFKLLYTLAAAGSTGVDFPNYYIHRLDLAQRYFVTHPPKPGRKIMKAYDFAFLLKNFGKGTAYQCNYNFYMKGSEDSQWFRIDSTWGNTSRFVPDVDYTVKHALKFKNLDQGIDKMIHFQVDLNYKIFNFGWYPTSHKTLRVTYEYERNEGPWSIVDDYDDTWPPLDHPIIWERGREH